MRLNRMTVDSEVCFIVKSEGRGQSKGIDVNTVCQGRPGLSPRGHWVWILPEGTLCGSGTPLSVGLRRRGRWAHTGFVGGRHGPASLSSTVGAVRRAVRLRRQVGGVVVMGQGGWVCRRAREMQRPVERKENSK